jgi:hypothetical protein
MKILIRDWQLTRVATHTIEDFNKWNEMVVFKPRSGELVGVYDRLTRSKEYQTDFRCIFPRATVLVIEEHSV